jgi:CxxC motif-containing protein
MRKKMICICCPIGCPLIVDYAPKKVQSVIGNRCKIGLDYAEKECFNPERTLTTTVRIKNGHLPLVSVRTNKPIPKNRIFDVMTLLAKVEMEAPIKIGEKIIENLFDAGVSIVATKNILKNRENFGT